MNRPQLSVTARDGHRWRAMRNAARIRALELAGLPADTPPVVRPWFNFRNATGAEGDRTVIDIYAEIGWFGITAQDFIDQLRTVDTSTIELHINSPGGDVYDGIAIYSALIDHPATVDCHIDALAASAASFIAQAGDKVTMGRNAEMMIHDAWGLCMGNAADMREVATLLDKASDNIASIYAARAGNGGTATWRKRMEGETWYSASEAVDVGLADTVAKTEPRRGDAAPPAGADNRVPRRPAASLTPDPAPDPAPAEPAPVQADPTVQPNEPDGSAQPDLDARIVDAFADITPDDLGELDPAGLHLAVLDAFDGADTGADTLELRARLEDWGWDPDTFRSTMLDSLEHADAPSDPLTVGQRARTTLTIDELQDALKGALE
jgi:ATP-dependent protease ClpP protease subunit